MLHLEAVTCAAADPERLAAFWAAVLGREPVGERSGVLLPGSVTQVGLRFVAEEAPRVAENRTHLHLTSAEPGDQKRTVARLLALGACRVDVGQRPGEGHIVLADPEGNPFCVIEHGNAYLARTGLLGEVACDGTRAVGEFWSAALGWPLVWDENDETAIQSPAGGTKVAWGGPPLLERPGPPRQWFDLVSDDVTVDVARLEGLGAARAAETVGGEGHVTLADPDGVPFRVASHPG